MKIKTWLKKSDRWIQGEACRTKDGFSTSDMTFIDRRKEQARKTKKGCGIDKTCLLGAVHYCYPKGHRVPVINNLKNVIRDLYGFDGIVEFNDATTTEFKDVKEVIRTAKV